MFKFFMMLLKPSFLKQLVVVFILTFVFKNNLISQTFNAQEIYKKYNDAVVVIHAFNNDKLVSQGSGVILNDKGFVVTNYHVYEGSTKIEIVHKLKVIPHIEIYGFDKEKDILILKIDSKNFPTFKIGNSNNLKIGQKIFTIGSPLGLENSISEGIISGLRKYEEVERKLIQITASISSGSSGGAVINDKGEIIGISTLTLKEGQSLNFAIPIEDVLQVENNYNDEDFNINSAEEYFKIGLAKQRLQDHRGAISDYNKVIELNPQYAYAYYNRGIAKYDLEDYRGAISDYNKAIELNPQYAEAYYNRGIAKRKLEDYRGAISDYNKAIELNPQDAAAYNNRGNAKHILKDTNGACLDWSKAGELGSMKAYDLIKEYCK